MNSGKISVTPNYIPTNSAWPALDTVEALVPLALVWDVYEAMLLEIADHAIPNGRADWNRERSAENINIIHL